MTDLGKSLARQLLLARLALFWEAFWRLGWPVTSLLALFVSLALFDILPYLPGWVHFGILIALAIALGFSLWRLRALRWPTLDQARGRLERDSGLMHRPLRFFADNLAAGNNDPIARGLWRVQQERLARVLGSITLCTPSADLPRHDPWGIRFAPLLLLAIALAGGWQDGPARLARALTPNLGSLGGPPPTLQVWVTPPDYTKLAPMLLENFSSSGHAQVPTGSKLLAQLQGGGGQAELRLGDDKKTFDSLDTDSQRLETTVTKGGKLEIHQGWRTIGSWNIDLIPDKPPAIAFSGPPAPDAQGRLKLDIDASDDYGIAKAWATIRRKDSPDADPLVIELPIGNGHPAKVHQSTWHDLTSNPWAGLPVTIQPGVADDAKQESTGDTVSVTLPERQFTHPVARAIITLRRMLAANPEEKTPIINGLEAIFSRPSAFNNDTVVFLALADARSRLYRDTTPQAVPSVLDILWQTALRIEEGNRPQAERELDNVRDALDKALADNAPQAEIDRLVQQLQAAIQSLLQSMLEQAARDGLEPMPIDPNAQMMTPQDLKDMLDQMRNLSATGSRDAARQMLDQLTQMLQNLRSGRPAVVNSQQMKQAQEMMQKLGQIARDQQALLDQSFRRKQQGGSQKESDAEAQAQEALRKRLGDAMQSLGDMGADIPKELGEAEQAMRGATKALRDGNMPGAMDAQAQALAKLQSGSNAAQQAMAQAMGMGQGQGMTWGMQRGGGPFNSGNLGGAKDRDPLGRQMNNGSSGTDNQTVKIPDRPDTQKAREVLEELRRRAGEPDRPADERDYLNRLLRQLF